LSFFLIFYFLFSFWGHSNNLSFCPSSSLLLGSIQKTNYPNNISSRFTMRMRSCFPDHQAKANSLCFFA
jgi:hypothetical protein